MDAVAGDILHIWRLRTTYEVPADHPRADGVFRFGDEVAARSLGDALAAVLPRWLPQGDAGVWCLRRVVTHLDGGMTRHPERLAPAWAGEIARALVAAMHREADGSELLYFPTRSAYVAQFLGDLASGRAWGKWYYQAFDGLRALPVSAALRTAICDDSEIGLSALLLLRASHLASVLEALTEADALLVLDRLAARTGPADKRTCILALWERYQAVGFAAPPEAEENRTALRLFLEGCRGHADLAGAHLKEAARAIARLARSPDRLAAVVDTLRTGDQAVSPLPATGPTATPFGGAFLLFPLLDELPLAEATAGWPDPEELSAVSLVRFLVLAKCLGSPRAERLFLDSCLRDLMGISPALTYVAASRWMARPSRANVHTFLRCLRDWYVETGAAGGRVLALASASPACGSTAIVVDCQRGVWLSGAARRGRSPGRVLEHLRDALEGAEVLLCDGAFLEAGANAFPRARVRPLDAAPGAEEQEVAEGLAGLRRLDDDLSYLALRQIPGAARAVDLALSVAAQGVMRTFAWRLPGFGRSSLPYLHDIFLDASASIEIDASRRVVRLGRPPLHLVLSIAGMARQTYLVSWLGALPCELFQEG